MIVLPPIEPDLFRLVDRANQQADPDREQLDFREGHLDVTSDHKTLVEHSVEHIDQTRGPSVPLSQWRRHKFRILRGFGRRRCFGLWARTGLSEQWKCQICYRTICAFP